MKGKTYTDTSQHFKDGRCKWTKKKTRTCIYKNEVTQSNLSKPHVVINSINKTFESRK